jgi:hypothetical protein
MLGASHPALAQTTQAGAKLFSTDYSGMPEQGTAAALSADGNTLVVGGYGDNSGVGATWVYTLSGGAWIEQAKLVATDHSGASAQGTSVAVSADGNTLAVGGDDDNNAGGAVWVFTRSGGSWTEQAKLVAADHSGAAQQGASVALSADGNNLIVGGPRDSNFIGAAWVFTRSGGTWTEQAKLVGTGYVFGSYTVQQGTSVALSGDDGNTAIVGGPYDSNAVGAVWVFTRSGSTWTQQAKLGRQRL